MTPHEVETVLKDWDPADFPRWITSLNRWQWPVDCPLACPPGWAMLSHHAQRQVAGALWAYLHAHTSQAAISHDWWVRQLGRTDAEWQAYWRREGCDCLDCLTLPREARGQHR